MNVELLRKIAALIQEQPENFNMNDWHCGTSHCIAGWADYLANGEIKVKVGCSERARKALDLGWEAHRLFYASSWPDQFLHKDFLYVQGSTPNARQAAARIEHFIATDGRE